MTRRDIFGEPFDDAHWPHLISDMNQRVLDRVGVIAKQILIVVKRQLQMYVARHPSQEEMDKTASAPHHNLEAERIMGINYTMNIDTY